MKCPYCGNDCSPRASACPKCGEPLHKQVNFRGAIIPQEEAQVLADIEKMANRTFVVGPIRFTDAGVPTSFLMSDGFPFHFTVLNGHVESVYCICSKMKSIPENIGQLSSLQALTVQNNNLATIPDSITQLSSLDELDLSQNQLIALPSAIGQLVTLRELRLSTNNLTNLPDSITQLTSLNELSLHSNQFIDFPSKIKQWISRLERNGCKVDPLWPEHQRTGY